jgi:tetratricopeptide (TPR) repeat protein
LEFVEREAWALIALNRTDEVWPLVDEIGRRREAEGASPTNQWGIIATELLAHGHEEAAQELLARAVDYYDSPFIRGLVGDTLPLGFKAGLRAALFLEGRFDDALPLQQEILASDPDNAAHLGHLGSIYAKMGDATNAHAVMERLEQLAIPRASARWQARIAALLGEKERAVNLLHRSYAEGLSYQYLNLHWDDGLWLLRGYGPFEELTRPKG